jgi:hypothetical protein
MEMAIILSNFQSNIMMVTFRKINKRGYLLNSMPKREMEFSDTEKLEWKPVEGMEGVYEKILSYDPDTGSYTRLLKFEKNGRGKEVLSHDFWEEAYIIKGTLEDLGKGLVFKEGMYACRPPGMKHGPYLSKEGCLLFEVRYYPERYCEKYGKK